MQVLFRKNICEAHEVLNEAHHLISYEMSDWTLQEQNIFQLLCDGIQDGCYAIDVKSSQRQHLRGV